MKVYVFVKFYVDLTLRLIIRKIHHPLPVGPLCVQAPNYMEIVHFMRLSRELIYLMSLLVRTDVFTNVVNEINILDEN